MAVVNLCHPTKLNDFLPNKLSAKTRILSGTGTPGWKD